MMNKLRNEIIKGEVDVFTHELTLQDLLMDDNFSPKLTTLSRDDLNYRNCVNMYIQGNQIGCLKKMHEYKLLDNLLVSVNFKNLKLFLSSLYHLESFDVIDATLRDILKLFFGNDIIKSSIPGNTTLDDINIRLLYYQCYLKFYVHDSLNSVYLNILEHEVKSFIKDLSIKTMNNNDEIIVFSKVIEFYLFDIQIDTFRKIPDISLYKDIQMFAPTISEKLGNMMLNKENKYTLEHNLIHKLEVKIKSKNSTRNIIKKSGVSNQHKNKKLSEIKTSSNAKPFELHFLKSFLSLNRLSQLFQSANKKLIIISVISILFSIKRARTLHILWIRGKGLIRTMLTTIISFLRTILDI